MTILNLGNVLETKYEWKSVDFDWKNPKQKELAINSGNYDVNACVLYDVDEAPGKLTLIHTI